MRNRFSNALCFREDPLRCYCNHHGTRTTQGAVALSSDSLAHIEFLNCGCKLLHLYANYLATIR